MILCHDHLIETFSTVVCSCQIGLQDYTVQRKIAGNYSTTILMSLSFLSTEFSLLSCSHFTARTTYTHTLWPSRSPCLHLDLNLNIILSNSLRTSYPVCTTPLFAPRLVSIFTLLCVTDILCFPTSSFFSSSSGNHYLLRFYSLFLLTGLGFFALFINPSSLITADFLSHHFTTYFLYPFIT